MERHACGGVVAFGVRIVSGTDAAGRKRDTEEAGTVSGWKDGMKAAGTGQRRKEWYKSGQNGTGTEKMVQK